MHDHCHHNPTSSTIHGPATPMQSLVDGIPLAPPSGQPPHQLRALPGGSAALPGLNHPVQQGGLALGVAMGRGEGLFHQPEDWEGQGWMYTRTSSTVGGR